MRYFGALAIVSGLILLSFFGAAMAVHGEGCLASSLQGGSCSGLLDTVQLAIFHSGHFTKLFQLTTSVIFVLILWLIVTAEVIWPPTIPNNFVFLEPVLNARAGVFRRWLTLKEHSPTY